MTVGVISFLDWPSYPTEVTNDQVITTQRFGAPEISTPGWRRPLVTLMQCDIKGIFRQIGAATTD